MITTIDIVDTAVKIGLGALISGVAAYMIARLNHAKETDKARLLRRRELLESVAEQVETFTQAVLRYWALTADRAKRERKNQAISEDLEQKWNEVYSILPEIFKEMTGAESKLLLLGENDSQKLLREYGEYIIEFKNDTFRSGQKLSEQTMNDYRTKILALRTNLFRSLSDIYKS